jgi:hypothetical protein
MKNSTVFHFRLRLLVFSLVLLLVNSPNGLSQTTPTETRSNQIGKPETRFQRWLPLPDGKSVEDFDLSDLLAQSRSPKSSDLPLEGSPQENAKLKQLRELMKQLGDKLPNDVKPPSLDGVSAEAIEKALRDPEIRKQAEKIVEKYAKQQEEQAERQRKKDSESPSPSQTNQKQSNSGSAGSPKTKSNENSFPPNKRPSETPQSKSLGSPKSQGNGDSRPSSKLDSNDPNERNLFDQEPFGTNTNGPTSVPSREIIESVEDFFKQVEQQDRGNNGENIGISSSSKEEAGGTAKGGTPETIKKNLNEKGFGKTLNEILEQAKKEANAKQESNARESRKEVTKQTVAPKKETKRSPQPETTDHSRKASTSVAREPSPSKADLENSNPTPSEPSAWSKWLSEMTSSILSNAVEIAPTGEPSTEQPGNGSWVPDWNGLAWRDFLSPWMIVAMVACLAACFATALLLREKRAAEETRDKSDLASGEYLQQPNKIRTREDVILAFHQLAYRIAHPLEDWSTHYRVERKAVRTAPEFQNPLRTLVQIYEQARYLPANVALTESQLASVREAIAQCEIGAR